jgi:hypothetical protein
MLRHLIRRVPWLNLNPDAVITKSAAADSGSRPQGG